MIDRIVATAFEKNMSCVSWLKFDMIDLTKYCIVQYMA